MRSHYSNCESIKLYDYCFKQKKNWKSNKKLKENAIKKRMDYGMTILKRANISQEQKRQRKKMHIKKNIRG